MALPLIPHCVIDPDCDGMLCEVIEDKPRFICNACDAELPVDQVQRIVIEMESAEANCPHCGRVNHIDGFSRIVAFTCRYCGNGVTL